MATRALRKLCTCGCERAAGGVKVEIEARSAPWVGARDTVDKARTITGRTPPPVVAAGGGNAGSSTRPGSCRTQLDASETTHRLAVVDRVLRLGVRQVEPMLEEIDSQHPLEIVRRPALARVRVVRLDQPHQPRPGNHRIHPADRPRWGVRRRPRSEPSAPHRGDSSGGEAADRPRRPG
jgi:hypothetical protein